MTRVQFPRSVSSVKLNPLTSEPSVQFGAGPWTFLRLKNSEWVQFLKWTEKLCEHAPAHRLKALSKIVAGARKRRFQRSSPKSAGVNRVFSDRELNGFMAALPSHAWRLFFLVQLSLALRIGEVCLLRKDQVNFIRHTITFREPKTGQVLEKPIPSSLWPSLEQHLKKTPGEYLFQSDKPPLNKKYALNSVSPNYARNVFRRACARAGIDSTYAISKDGRQLHTLATHSFRRTGITRMAEALNGDLFKLKTYSGHSSVSSLEKYVQYSASDEIKKKINDVF